MRPADAHEEEISSLEPELECAPQGPVRLTETPWSAPISASEARDALAKTEALVAKNQLSDALIELRVVEHAMPRIQDRIALRRAEILLRLGRTAEACNDYALAEQSPERNVAAIARIALVRCMLDAGQRGGEAELQKVMSRYPHMGERSELRLALARARETWNDTFGAIALYRELDLNEPETEAASDARTALARLRAAGEFVRPYTALERVERAEKIQQRGTIEAGHDAVAELLASNLEPPLLGRAHLIAARIARIEGRFEIVRDEVALAIKLGAPQADGIRLLPRGPVSDDADPAARAAEGESRIKHILAGKTIARAPSSQLRPVLDIAVQFGLADRATEALQAMLGRSQANVPPSARFYAGILGAGLASDDSVAALLASVGSTGKYALGALYHHARALERLKRYGEAEAEYLRVLHDDKASPGYYAMWADLRLWSMQSEQKQSCMPDAVAKSGEPSAEPAKPDAVQQAMNDVLALPEPRSDGAVAAVAAVEHADESDADAEPEALASNESDVATNEAQVRAAARAQAAQNAARREKLLSQLGGLASTYGAAYPWLARAADLVELELFEDAADEVSEAYLAWRDARGDLRLRSGLEAVLTGAAPPRHAMDVELRKARRTLDGDLVARKALADVADELGDPGVSLRFVQLRGDMRPRAYADAVQKAAAKYGIDANLLFAVMRVESVYHRQIVSFAGAVGLMQIMPRTGMLIARKLGVEHFAVSDLLDPNTNVEFAAWYLSSLIKRFDGAVPLAIAAYNGGPHNVRLWMRETHPNMPLDAFLERIPFDETNAYVRRVLTHYAAYRAQQNLPMTRLDVTLPGEHPDSMAF